MVTDKFIEKPLHIQATVGSEFTKGEIVRVHEAADS